MTKPDKPTYMEMRDTFTRYFAECDCKQVTLAFNSVIGDYVRAKKIPLNDAHILKSRARSLEMYADEVIDAAKRMDDEYGPINCQGPVSV